MKEIGIEQCINAVRRDKHSTWLELMEKVKVKSWKQIFDERKTEN